MRYQRQKNQDYTILAVYKLQERPVMAGYCHEVGLLGGTYSKKTLKNILICRKCRILSVKIQIEGSKILISFMFASGELTYGEEFKIKKRW